MIRTGRSNIQNTRETQKIILEAAFTAGIDDASPMKLDVLDNDTAQGDYEENVDVPIIMTDSEKTEYQKWVAHIQRDKGSVEKA